MFLILLAISSIPFISDLKHGSLTPKGSKKLLQGSVKLNSNLVGKYISTTPRLGVHKFGFSTRKRLRNTRLIRPHKQTLSKNANIDHIVL